jgi:hypothetical protein
MHPDADAEAPPMNASDYPGVIERAAEATSAAAHYSAIPTERSRPVFWRRSAERALLWMFMGDEKLHK